MAYLTKLEDIPQLSDGERERLKEVAYRFYFKANDYYTSLIDWDDPDDPIRKIIIPDVRELVEWGKVDPSGEKTYTKAPGLQHKYRQTALLLANDVCGGFCRFCFRKRLFIEDENETMRDISEGLEYIRNHSEITNVLLTGGDPLLMSTTKLENIIRQIREIEHVQIIRIGSKMPAFNPHRIIDDPELLKTIKMHSTREKRIYIVTHFNHPRELTDEAVEGLKLLQQAGAITVSQTPLLKGVNDDPEVLAELFKKLSFIGVSPYYVFQCRPTIANKHFAVPVEEAYGIVEKAKARCSGLAKRAKYVMSHSSGKIEVLGVTEKYTHFKYQQAARPEDIGMFMVYSRNPEACWFDDYTDPVEFNRICDEGAVSRKDGDMAPPLRRGQRRVRGGVKAWNLERRLKAPTPLPKPKVHLYLSKVQI